jgi:hypothetical protein
MGHDCACRFRWGFRLADQRAVVVGPPRGITHAFMDIHAL